HPSSAPRPFARGGGSRLSPTTTTVFSLVTDPFISPAEFHPPFPCCFCLRHSTYGGGRIWTGWHWSRGALAWSRRVWTITSRRLRKRRRLLCRTSVTTGSGTCRLRPCSLAGFFCLIPPIK